MDSPKQGDSLQCPSCGNEVEFVGIDHHGYGGPEACQYGHEEPCSDEECVCNTKLSQPFEVVQTSEGQDWNFHAFIGGEDDSQIGDYNQIDCARCGAEVYRYNG